MRVEHLDRTPVHVVGHARSGALILVELIRRHLAISIGTESQFIVRYHRRLREYGNLSENRNLRRLIDDLSNERCFERWRKFQFHLDKEAVFQETLEPTYAGVLRAVFGQLARHMGMVRWGDRTPEYIYDLPVLDELFPDAKYIHLVRDGRDVALSMRDFHHGGKNAFKAAQEWRTSVVIVRRFFEALAPDRCIEIRYEDLLAAPTKTFAKLGDFLCIENSEEMSRTIAPELCAELRRNNSFKWKLRLPKSEQKIFEELAGDILAAYGYETQKVQVRPPGLWESLYWNADHAMKQATDSRWWTDAFYRASLRLGDHSHRWLRSPTPSSRPSKQDSGPPLSATHR